MTKKKYISRTQYYAKLKVDLAWVFILSPVREGSTLSGDHWVSVLVNRAETSCFFPKFSLPILENQVTLGGK